MGGDQADALIQLGEEHAELLGRIEGDLRLIASAIEAVRAIGAQAQAALSVLALSGFYIGVAVLVAAVMWGIWRVWRAALSLWP